MAEPLSRGKKQEYATKVTLMGVFLSLFSAFVARLGIWSRNKEPYSLKPFDLVLLALATLRLGRMVAYDRIAEPLRQPFCETLPDPTGAGETVEPRGEGWRYSLGQMLSCPICVGTWISAGLVYGLHSIPTVTRPFLSIMATMGLTEVLNALVEILSWTGQLARVLSGHEDEGLTERLFNSGGKYYVGHDHEKYYR